MKPEVDLELEPSHKAIFDLDLHRVIDKISRKENSLTGIEKPWSRSRAIEAVDLYKRYLWLVRKYKNKHPFLPPSLDIDTIWHAHILDTKRYQQDCLKIFGSFLHHDPYFGLDGEKDEKRLIEAFEITQKLHFQEFGDYIYELED